MMLVRFFKLGVDGFVVKDEALKPGCSGQQQKENLVGLAMRFKTLPEPVKEENWMKR
jgi:hypothetical protein